MVSIIAGIAVLIGAIAASNQARSYDSVIMRTLGATRGQVMLVQAIEYALLAAVLACVALAFACLVKAYVGDGIGADFYREISAYVDADTRALVLDVCDDLGQSELIIDRVRAAIQEDPRAGGRLALWGRRLVGEALSQAQRVAADRDALSTLLVGGVDRPGTDLAEIGRMLARLTDSHSKRMAALGLAA